MDSETAYLRFLARQVESPAQFEAIMVKVEGGVMMREAVREKLLPLLRSDIRREVERLHAPFVADSDDATLDGIEVEPGESFDFEDEL